MKIFKILSLLMMLLLGIYASVSDIREGIIKNRILAIAAAYAIIADTAYYGFFAQDLGLIFLLNAAIVTVIALVLFYTHSWAGGDCKLLCVFGLLYPADCYLSYNGQAVTLVFCAAFAFLLGYGFLVVNYVIAALQRKTHFSVNRIKQSLLTFLRSYIQVLISLTAIHLIYELTLSKLIEINSILLIAVDFCLAWLIGSLKVLHKKEICILVLVFDVTVSVILRTIPIGTNWANYLFVLGVVLLRIIITEQNYQTIPTSDVKRGMILSTATSIQFLGSRVKGLPGISKEDLRSRLTEEEAESVRRWEYSVFGQPFVTIVRKIPFAIFICFGFLIYYIIWSVI